MSSTEIVLDVKEVSKQYHKHIALNKVSMAVPRQSVYGLLGPNGAGKTSLIRMITQITGIDEGEIFFMGEKLNPRHIKEIGYLPEERGLYKNMKVGEQLIYLGRLKGIPEKELKKNLGFWLTRLDMRDWWEKKISELSKGMQQKVQFIATVIHKPKFIILDEPFSGFDPVNTDVIRKEILRLREEGATILFSTHRMESVEEICDHITLIHKSQIVLQGEKKTIKQRYRSNTWEVQASGVFPSFMKEHVEVISMQEEEGDFLAVVKLPEAMRGKDLVELFQGKVELHSLREIVPTMDEIFLRNVREESIVA